MDANKKTVYIETTIPSFATARISSDVIIAGQQELTKLFWARDRRNYELVTSEVVIEECRDSDPEAARKRLEFLKNIPVLPKTKEAQNLAIAYQNLLQIPERSKADSIHLSLCVLSRIDYLLSWNCKHLGLKTYEKMKEYNTIQSLFIPQLITPEQLTYTIYEGLL
jgi:predicted nucleic acid-binding protein